MLLLIKLQNEDEAGGGDGRATGEDAAEDDDEEEEEEEGRRRRRREGRGDGRGMVEGYEWLPSLFHLEGRNENSWMGLYLGAGNEVKMRRRETGEVRLLVGCIRFGKIIEVNYDMK